MGMLVTEAEAKEKWCPLARSRLDGREALVGNRSPVRGYAQVNAMCLGTACMFWNWVESEYTPIPSTEQKEAGIVLTRGYPDELEVADAIATARGWKIYKDLTGGHLYRRYQRKNEFRKGECGAVSLDRVIQQG